MITVLPNGVEIVRAPDSMDGSEGLLALIIRGSYSPKPGVTFVSPEDAQQQVGFLNHKRGTIIQPHTHNPIERRSVGTQEVLIIELGSCDIDFYTSDGNFVCRTELLTQDIVQLLSGGHGLVMREDCHIIEIKSGPYAGKDDKTLLPREKGKYGD